MELTPRKKAILCSLIRTYIVTGEPVGSKTESLLRDIGVSSATLRNEMSDLCEMGYLMQPHTSAGRVPTNLGYRVYTDALRENMLVSDSTKRLINGLLTQALTDPENLPETASEILSDITGLPTIISSVRTDSCFVRRVEMSPMSRRSLIMVVLTSDGIARSRMCRLASDITTDKLMRIDYLIRKEIIGTPLDLFDNLFLNRLFEYCGDWVNDFAPILNTIFNIVKDIVNSRIRIGGRDNIARNFSNSDDVKGLLNFVSENKDFADVLFERADQPLSIVFGDRTGYKELAPVNLVVSKYYTSDTDYGFIGVIGPTRMNYEKLLPNIKYFAARFGDTMVQAIKDLNDWEG